jgi:hypothetical protein
MPGAKLRIRLRAGAHLIAELCASPNRVAPSYWRLPATAEVDACGCRRTSPKDGRQITRTLIIAISAWTDGDPELGC